MIKINLWVKRSEDLLEVAESDPKVGHLVLPATSDPPTHMSNPRNTQSANWLYTQHDTDAFYKSNWYQCVYLQYHVFQVEQCPSTGTWHIQGFIQYTKRMKGTTVQNMLGGPCHIEPAKNVNDCRTYCMKEETRVTPTEEFGVFNAKTGQGQRTDLNDARDRIRAHTNYASCLDDYSLDSITSRFPRWVHEQLSRVPHLIRPKPTVIVYYGPTQTGKTARCHADYPGIHEMRLDNGFMNYVGQDVVLFDEFDKDPWPFGLMLKLLDVYPFQVNIKNGYCYWEAKTICITASGPPEDWYLEKKGYRPEWYPQLERRITKIINTAPVKEGGMDLDD